jgi:hypothetical protein
MASRDRRVVAIVGLCVLALAEALGAETGAGTPAWRRHLQRMNEALARRDVSRASSAWHDAYGAALASRRWEALLSVGDAHLALGTVRGDRKSSEPRARDAYLHAFFRARTAGSLEGILQSADAFAALGDRDVSAALLRVADGMARKGGDAAAIARVRQRLERLNLEATRRDPAAPTARPPMP